MSLILVIKDLEQYYELNMILGELLFTITLGDIEDTIVSQIGVKGNILILLHDIHRIRCLLSIVT